jgi:calcineurin-like phosphoesterase family protein
MNLNKRKPITWFTSDIHHDHKKIVEFTDRGRLTTQEDHTEWLIDTWNNQVQKQDNIYHIGDFSFCTNSNELLVFTRKLNGQKFLIKGNHDRSKNLEILTKENAISNWWEYKEIKIENIPVCLFHFPIASWNRMHHGAIQLHGHSHGNYKGNGKQLDVGLDSAFNLFLEYKFFSETDVLEYMNRQQIQPVDHHVQKVNNEIN